ncbi:MAG: C40 family peptidase [Saprospiraceae bacterium]
MKINGLSKVIVFTMITFLLASCDAFKSVNSGSSSTNSTKKVDATMVKRKNVTNYGQKYVGVKYKYAGKDPKGFDCSGFTSYVMKSEGITVSSSSKMQATEGKSVPLNKVKPGDLIFFGKNGKVSHVAMVVSNTSDGISVVHSTSSKGVMVQNITKSTYWKPMIMFARDVISQ